MIKTGIYSPYNFGKRITSLMQSNGINTDTKTPNPDMVLAKRIFKMDLMSLEYDDYCINDKDRRQLERKKIDNVRKSIHDHRKIASATNVSGKWIDIYCRVLGCDSDYLFGYTDYPRKLNRATDITSSTGLSVSNARMLIDYNRFSDKWKRYEDLRAHPPRRKTYEDSELNRTIELYEDPEYDRAIEEYRIEYNRAVKEYRQEMIRLKDMYPDIPVHLVHCFNKLLDSCREHSETGNIIDLIYQYAFSPLPRDIDVVHLYPGEKETHRDYKGTIQSSDYLSINVIDEYDISELLRQSQLNDIIFKLSELRKESKEKGEKAHGTD